MKRVMIVDDALFMRASIKQMLVKNGFEVVGEATNGAEAVQRYEELHPDFVTMDITMPEMDGVAATRALVAIDPSCRILIVSAMGHESFVKESIMAGARNFIVKPFTEDALLSAIAKL
jgi:two-component system chemotaxis response regulator CheY